MKRYLVGLLVVAAAAAPAGAQPSGEAPPPPGGAAVPGVCVTIDPARDTLTEQERLAVRTLVLQAFERERLPADATGTACAETYAVTNVKLGNTVTVTIAGPRGTRTGRASTLDDLPNVYSQMVRSLVTGAAMETGGGTTDRTNVTRDQAAPRRVAADNMKYASLGYGGIVAGRVSRGGVFGGGYRRELDRIALDISMSFVVGTDDPNSDGATFAIPRLLFLLYQDPLQDGSMYYGGGVSYGFTAADDKEGDSYAGAGMQGHLVAGYEAFRSSTLRAFVQLEATLPFYTSKLDFGSGSGSRYTPTFSINLGFGWGKSNTLRVIND
ncbi:MAG: hypothetical protein KIT31_23995 [Deltaproteobacteria bacterium]|nr:hypothetical protein [Deltaproteobacteria bacterium]